MKIVDSSAIIAVLLDEAERPAIQALITGERLLAPSLLVFEITNSCAMHAKRFPDLQDRFTDALIDFLNLDIELREVDIVGTFALARRHDLTAYDASYLWLSRELGVELITLDRDLADAAQNLRP